ncbi:MAG: hypothetical protein U1F77_03610 [Kiritimatiellia bacterium]
MEIPLFEFQAGTRRDLIAAANDAIQRRAGEIAVEVRPWPGMPDGDWIKARVPKPVQLRHIKMSDFLDSVAESATMYWAMSPSGYLEFLEAPRFVTSTHDLEPDALSRFPQLVSPPGDRHDWARDFFCDLSGNPTPESRFTKITLPTILFDPLLRRFEIRSQTGDLERIAEFLRLRFPPARRVRIDATWIAVPATALNKELAAHPALTQEQLRGLYQTPGRRILVTHSTQLLPGKIHRIHAGGEITTPRDYLLRPTNPSPPGDSTDLAAAALPHPTGMMMDIEAELPADGKSIRLSLEAELGDVHRWLDVDANTPAGKPEGEGGGVQTPVIRRFKYQASFSCADGGTTVLGGHSTPEGEEAVFLYLTASIETPTTPPPATDPP